MSEVLLPSFAGQSIAQVEVPEAEQVRFNRVRAERQQAKLLANLTRAAETGGPKAVKKAVSRYLRSRNCAILASLEARTTLPGHRRPSIKEAIKIGAAMDVELRCTERVYVTYRAKEGKNRDFRPILIFGLENKARQIHVRNALQRIARLHAAQFATQGGRDAALEAVTKAYAQGYRYVVNADIQNCFGSLRKEGLKEELRLPAGVVENVMIGENLSLEISQYISSILGEFRTLVPVEEAFTPEDLAAVRRGIPQGSAASPLVAEMLLSPVIEKLPKIGVVVNQADNFLMLAKSENDAAELQRALRGALWRHPAGPLTLGLDEFTGPGEPFNFLGYHIETIATSATLKFFPSDRNFNREEMRHRQLRNIMLDPEVPKTIKRHFLNRHERRMKSWFKAFRLWQGIEQFRLFRRGQMDDIVLAAAMNPHWKN